MRLSLVSFSPPHLNPCPPVAIETTMAILRRVKSGTFLFFTESNNAPRTALFESASEGYYVRPPN